MKEEAKKYNTINPYTGFLQPLLILARAKDGLTSLGVVKSLLEKAEESREFVVLENADRNPVLSSSQEKVLKLTVDWLSPCVKRRKGLSVVVSEVYSLSGLQSPSDKRVFNHPHLGYKIRHFKQFRVHVSSGEHNFQVWRLVFQKLNNLFNID